MINLKEYPLMSKTPLNLRPMAVFRIEGVPFSVSTPIGQDGPDSDVSEWENRNALLMFTGLLTTDSDGGSDYLHCVPLMFYRRDGDQFHRSIDLECPKPFGVWLEIYTDLYVKDAYSNLTAPGAFN